MRTAAVDSPEIEQVLEWEFLDTLVVERGRARAIETVVPEMSWPVGATPSVGHDIRPERRHGRLVARWVPDPNDESGLLCVWVPRTGTDASAPSLDPCFGHRFTN